MNPKQSGSMSYFEFESFTGLGAEVRFYTRHGGVSPYPWSSLNQGGTVGDNRENVVENRRRIFGDIDRPVESIFDVWQVHGTNVICAAKPRGLAEDHQKADAIFTDHADITLFMRFADCVPIVLFEPERKVIGIVHAGWKGTVDSIVVNAIQTAQQKYGIAPDKLIAGIGPSIGPDHYQVGMEVKEKVEETFGDQSQSVLRTHGSAFSLNLWRANEILLRKAGVKNIEVAEVCTACHTDDWFSHRKENGSTGRFAAIAFLR